MQRVKRETIQELLSHEVDARSDDFWAAFRLCLEVSSGSDFDRRAIINLKLLLSTLELTEERIQLIALLVSKTGSGLKNEVTSDLGDLFIQIMLNNRGRYETAAVSFSNALRTLCNRNPMIKNVMHRTIIEPFSKWICGGSQLSHWMATELFLMSITLISGPECVRSEFREGVSHEQICHASKYMLSCKDSITQITIAEWIWRSIRILKMNESDVTKAIGKLSNIVSIDKTNFRESLHNFIRAINGPPREDTIIHIPFKNVKIGGRQIECRGCFDVNFDNAAIIFNEKKADIPDVVIFRSNYITRAGYDNQIMTFITRENNIAISSDPDHNASSTEVTLKIDGSPNQDSIKEYLKRLKKTRVDRRSIDILPDIPQRSRTRAPKKTRNINSKYGEIMSEIPILTNDSSANLNKSMVKKSSDIHEIEAKIEEYANKSQNNIESSYNLNIQNTKDIIKEIDVIQSSLTHLQSQHIEVTSITSSENASLKSSVNEVQSEFESHHKEASSRRENLKNESINSILSDEKEICSHVCDSFNTNAIVGFSEALDNLAQRLQAIQIVN